MFPPQFHERGQPNRKTDHRCGCGLFVQQEGFLVASCHTQVILRRRSEFLVTPLLLPAAMPTTIVASAHGGAASPTAAVAADHRQERHGGDVGISSSHLQHPASSSPPPPPVLAGTPWGLSQLTVAHCTVLWPPMPTDLKLFAAFTVGLTVQECTRHCIAELQRRCSEVEHHQEENATSRRRRAAAAEMDPFHSPLLFQSHGGRAARLRRANSQTSVAGDVTAAAATGGGGASGSAAVVTSAAPQSDVVAAASFAKHTQPPSAAMESTPCAAGSIVAAPAPLPSSSSALQSVSSPTSANAAGSLAAVVATAGALLGKAGSFVIGGGSAGSMHDLPTAAAGAAATPSGRALPVGSRLAVVGGVPKISRNSSVNTLSAVTPPPPRSSDDDDDGHPSGTSASDELAHPIQTTTAADDQGLSASGEGMIAPQLALEKLFMTGGGLAECDARAIMAHDVEEQYSLFHWLEYDLAVFADPYSFVVRHTLPFTVASRRALVHDYYVLDDGIALAFLRGPSDLTLLSEGRDRDAAGPPGSPGQGDDGEAAAAALEFLAANIAPEDRASVEPQDWWMLREPYLATVRMRSLRRQVMNCRRIFRTAGIASQEQAVLETPAALSTMSMTMTDHAARGGGASPMPAHHGGSHHPHHGGHGHHHGGGTRSRRGDKPADSTATTSAIAPVCVAIEERYQISSAWAETYAVVVFALEHQLAKGLGEYNLFRALPWMLASSACIVIMQQWCHGSAMGLQVTAHFGAQLAALSRAFTDSRGIAELRNAVWPAAGASASATATLNASISGAASAAPVASPPPPASEGAGSHREAAIRAVSPELGQIMKVLGRMCAVCPRDLAGALVLFYRLVTALAAVGVANNSAAPLSSSVANPYAMPQFNVAVLRELVHLFSAASVKFSHPVGSSSSSLLMATAIHGASPSADGSSSSAAATTTAPSAGSILAHGVDGSAAERFFTVLKLHCQLLIAAAETGVG